MTFTGKIVYMAHHLILLRLKVDMEEWRFEYSMS